MSKLFAFLLKGVCYERKDYAPYGNIFFSYKRYFLVGAPFAEKQTDSHKSSFHRQQMMEYKPVFLSFPQNIAKVSVDFLCNQYESQAVKIAL